jgi:uncharacterized protein (TIGR02996 family)
MENFLKANPDDPVQLLIYADWLEEHGCPYASQFIRASAKLLSKGIKAVYFHRGTKLDLTTGMFDVGEGLPMCDEDDVIYGLDGEVSSDPDLINFYFPKCL